MIAWQAVPSVTLNCWFQSRSRQTLTRKVPEKQTFSHARTSNRTSSSQRTAVWLFICRRAITNNVILKTGINCLELIMDDATTPVVKHSSQHWYDHAFAQSYLRFPFGVVVIPYLLESHYGWRCQVILAHISSLESPSAEMAEPRYLKDATPFCY